MKMLEKMDMVDAIISERATSFIFPQPENLGSPIITVKMLISGMRLITPCLKNIDLRIDMEDRIGLLGANGNGKSTLIKLLSGKLEAMAGEI